MPRVLVLMTLLWLPALAWWSVETERAKVLYAPGQEELAAAVLSRAEAALDELDAFFGPGGEKVILRLAPGEDYFDGYANVFPRPATTLLPAFPYYQGLFLNNPDPLYTLVLHELVHLRHLRGPENPLGLIPSGVSRPYPAWLTEGLATYLESKGGGGRLHDAYARAVLLALAQDPPSLAALSSAPYPRWPYGEARYLVGAAFVDYLIRRHGKETLTAAFREYNRVPMPQSLLLPDGFSDAWEKAAGTRLEEEWRGFWSEIRAEGSPSEEVSGPRGRLPAALSGRLAFLDEDRIVVGERAFRRPLFRTIGGLTWLDPDTLVYDRLAFEADGRLTRRLFALDVTSGRETPLPARHAYYPAAHRGQLYYVREDRRGSCLVALAGEGGRDLLCLPPGEHLVGVAAGEEGVAVLVWRAGQVRPYLVGAGGETRPLPAPGRILLGPFWWRGWLVYRSDAAGVFQLYATDPETGEVLRLTDLPLGAYGAAPEGGELVVATLTREGHRLTRLSPSPRPAEPAAGPSPAPPSFPKPEARPRPYRPSGLAPAGWLPIAPAGAAVMGVDEADEIAYLLAAYSGPGGPSAAGEFSYTPRFGLSASSYGLSFSLAPGRVFALARYHRGFYPDPAWGRFELAAGVVGWERLTPLLAAELSLAQAASYGRDRVWGLPSEGGFFSLHLGLEPDPTAELWVRGLFPEGVEVSLAAGLGARDPALLAPGGGEAFLARLGYRLVIPVDLYRKDGLFYLSHLELWPRAGVLYAGEPLPELELRVDLHLVLRYYLTASPSLRLGYRPDLGFWVGLGG